MATNHGFLCHCDPPMQAFFDVCKPLDRWPICYRCGSRHDIVNPGEVPWPPGFTAEDMTITPELAASWMVNVRPVEPPNDRAIVAQHARLMASGKWVDLTLDHGGVLHPIVFDADGYIRYGLQRLEACILAGTSFRATVVRFPITDKELDHG